MNIECRHLLVTSPTGLRRPAGPRGGPWVGTPFRPWGAAFKVSLPVVSLVVSSNLWILPQWSPPRFLSVFCFEKFATFRKVESCSEHPESPHLQLTDWHFVSPSLCKYVHVHTLSLNNLKVSLRPLHPWEVQHLSTTNKGILVYNLDAFIMYKKFYYLIYNPYLHFAICP